VAFSAAILLSAVRSWLARRERDASPLSLGAGGRWNVVLYVLARNRAWALAVYQRSAHAAQLQKLVETCWIPLSGLAILTDGWLFIRFLFWMAINWAIAIGQFCSC